MWVIMRILRGFGMSFAVAGICLLVSIAVVVANSIFHLGIPMPPRGSAYAVGIVIGLLLVPTAVTGVIAALVGPKWSLWQAAMVFFVILAAISALAYIGYISHQEATIGAP